MSTAESTNRAGSGRIESLDNHAPIIGNGSVVGIESGLSDGEATTQDNHAPAPPGKKGSAKDGGPTPQDNHAPIGTTDNHAPITTMDNHAPSEGSR